MPAFKVTDAAGAWVAGQRVQPGQVLVLTERQAEHELRRGTLILVGAAEAAAASGSIEAATAQLTENTAELEAAVKGNS